MVNDPLTARSAGVRFRFDKGYSHVFRSGSILVAAAAAALSFAAPAFATPVAIADGNSLTVTSGAYTATFTVANCDPTACADQGAVMSQDDSKLGVTITGSSGPVVSSGDFGFDFDVTVSPAVSVLTITGSGPDSGGRIHRDDRCHQLPRNQCELPCCDGLAVVSRRIDPDALAGRCLPIGSVNSFTLDFNAVPEPPRLGSLVMGILGLALRRRQSA